METIKKYQFLYSVTLLFLVTMVIGKPLIELYKQYLDDSIELCENSEKENLEEKELEDDLKEEGEKYFLITELDSISTITSYVIQFHYRLQAYLKLYLETPFHPPKQA